MNFSSSSSYSSFPPIRKQTNHLPKKVIKPPDYISHSNQNNSSIGNHTKIETSDDPFVISSDTDSFNHDIDKNTPELNKNNTQESSFASSFSVQPYQANPETEYIIYKCKKVKSFSFAKKQLVFNLTLSNEANDTVLYSAKFRPSGINPAVSLFKGSDCHLKEDNAEGIILTSEKLTKFSLRKRSRYGNEIMSLKFIKSLSKKPRSIQIYVYIDTNSNIESNCNKPIYLRNLEPKKTVFGTWELNLNAPSVLASSKNCLIINDSTKETVFILRKVQKRVFEIEAMNSLSLLQLFALAISSLLCRLK